MSTSLFPTLPTKQPYYIVAPPFLRTSAGVKVLHLLCHTLRQIGYEAFIISLRLNSYFDTPKLNEDQIRSDFDAGLTPIVIYPETVVGNPLRAPFVVRYILNYPGLLGGPADFASTDFRVSYARGLDEAKMGKAERVLFFPASDTATFYPPTVGAPRSGSCFYAAKYIHIHRGKLFDITRESVEITRDLPGSQNPREIADLFRASEVFYCYENSALSLEALLCGCPVVLLPNPFFTEMIAQNELGRDGIAWGPDPAELIRARATVGLVWTNYQKLQIGRAHV